MAGRAGRILHGRVGLPVDLAARDIHTRRAERIARVMKCRTAYLIINPRLGKNVAKLTDMIAVFSAALPEGA
jgi:hypothetical protein